jgi:hypothetical protein
MENQVMAKFMLVPLIVLLAGCAASPASNGDDIPAPLRVSAGGLSTRQTHATGVQIYQCRGSKDDAARFQWQLKEPAANLFDKSGHKIGKHYAGPTWEADDGSKVIGEVVARADSPDPNAVTWLLLSAKSTSGTGIFQGVRFVQRLHTAGGNAPAGGCDQAAAGSEVQVPYSADYWFYAAGR